MIFSLRTSSHIHAQCLLLCWRTAKCHNEQEMAVREWLMHVHKTASLALIGMQCRAGDVSTNRDAQEGDLLIAGFIQRAVEHAG